MADGSFDNQVDSRMVRIAFMTRYTVLCAVLHTASCTAVPTCDSWVCCTTVQTCDFLTLLSCYFKEVCRVNHRAIQAKCTLPHSIEMPELLSAICHAQRVTLRVIHLISLSYLKFDICQTATLTSRLIENSDMDLAFVACCTTNPTRSVM